MIRADELLSVSPKPRAPIDRTGKHMRALDAYLSIPGNSLTMREALILLGCGSLSQRMGDLLRDGKPVIKKWETSENGARIIRYSYAHQGTLL